MKAILLILTVTISVLTLTFLASAAVSSRKKDLAKQKHEPEESIPNVHDVEVKTNQLIKEVRPVIWRLIMSQNEDGETPFHVAAKNGNLALIDALLPHIIRHPGLLQSMFNVKNKDGKTALELAQEAGHAAVVDKIKALMDTDHYKLVPLRW